MNVTSNAFGVNPPDVANLSLDDALHAYALFTRDETQKSIDRRLLIKNRLFVGGRTLGQELRRILNIRTKEDVLDAAQILYRMIGIDFHRARPGEIEVTRCYFGQFYSSEVCKTMASLDEGIFAGLSGDGELKFYQTITEGNTSCKGTVTLKGL